jgi:hypothetical protein
MLAAAGLLWPSRLSGPLDGMPLDRPAEAIAIGVVFPALWWCHPQFLRTRLARGLVLALVGWKALGGMTLVQDGWCLRVLPAAPLAKDAAGAPHSWDVRADWRSPNPACSAIVTRSYLQLSEFPAWFFNLPPPRDELPVATDRPPGATTRMTVIGFLRAARAGALRIVTGPDVAAAVLVDGRRVSSEDANGGGVTLAPGTHMVSIDATLTGDRWQFAPRWNDDDLWSASVMTSAAIGTVSKPSRRDLVIRPWGRWIAAALVVVLEIGWLASVVARVRNTRSLRNGFGAFLVIGVPWMTFIVIKSAPLIGRFTLYTAGDDYWMFQRWAYRIFMQGYWLHGGESTFWFQPLYRWIAGTLHLVFGDSSVGEWYWDGACLLVMALFSFHAAKAFAGFWWGLVAAASALAIVIYGPTWMFIGRGLSEISSAGFIYLAALVALRSRHGPPRRAIAAGALATLAFFTRLNNLPMAAAVAVFALPRKRAVVGVLATLTLGLFLFACRTWYYTGMFSVFYGTGRYALALWQPGMALGTVLERMAGSLLMVLTMHDPPEFDPLAIPLLLGVSISVLAVLRVPRVRDLPLGLVVFCLAAASGSLVARGSAYSGRFSIHIIGVSIAVVTCAIALAVSRIPSTRSMSSS